MALPPCNRTWRRPAEFEVIMVSIKSCQVAIAGGHFLLQNHGYASRQPNAIVHLRGAIFPPPVSACCAECPRRPAGRKQNNSSRDAERGDPSRSRGAIHLGGMFQLSSRGRSPRKNGYFPAHPRCATDRSQ